MLNLCEVPYMDSSAIAVLVEALQKIRKTGGKVYLTDLCSPASKACSKSPASVRSSYVTKDEAEALEVVGSRCA